MGTIENRPMESSQSLFPLASAHSTSWNSVSLAIINCYKQIQQTIEEVQRANSKINLSPMLTELKKIDIDAVDQQKMLQVAQLQVAQLEVAQKLLTLSKNIAKEIKVYERARDPFMLQSKWLSALQQCSQELRNIIADPEKQNQLITHLLATLRPGETQRLSRTKYAQLPASLVISKGYSSQTDKVYAIVHGKRLGVGGQKFLKEISEGWVLARPRSTHSHMPSEDVLGELKEECFVQQRLIHIESKHTAQITPALIMEFCPTDLEKILHSDDPADFHQIATYFHALAQAIDCLHSKSIVHLDLKLDNVLIGTNGNIKLSDFDLSKKIVGIEENVVAGTASHYPPGDESQEEAHLNLRRYRQLDLEQAKRLDLYALGQMLKELGVPRQKKKALQNLISKMQDVKNSLLTAGEVSKEIEHLFRLKKNEEDAPSVAAQITLSTSEIKYIIREIKKNISSCEHETLAVVAQNLDLAEQKLDDVTDNPIVYQKIELFFNAERSIKKTLKELVKNLSESFKDNEALIEFLGNTEKQSVIDEIKYLLEISGDISNTEVVKQAQNKIEELQGENRQYNKSINDARQQLQLIDKTAGRLRCKLHDTESQEQLIQQKFAKMAPNTSVKLSRRIYPFLLNSIIITKDQLGEMQIEEYKHLSELGSGGQKKVKESQGGKAIAKALDENIVMKIDYRAKQSLFSKIGQVKGMMPINLLEVHTVHGISYRQVMQKYSATLADKMIAAKEQEQPIETKQVVRYYLSLINAIEELHKIDIVHLDIKPDNVFLDQNGELVIGDFDFMIELSEGQHLIDPGNLLFYEERDYQNERFTAQEAKALEVYALTYLFCDLILRSLDSSEANREIELLVHQIKERGMNNDLEARSFAAQKELLNELLQKLI